MPTYDYDGYVTYSFSGTTATFGTRIETPGTLDDGDLTGQFVDGEPLSPLGNFEGTLDVGGQILPVTIDGNIFYIFIPAGTGPTTNFPFQSTFDTSLIDHSGYTPCFAAGTMILTANGEKPVETIEPDDRLMTPEGGHARVLWLGRKAVSPLFGTRNQPVRFRAGALGHGLPHSDLTVTADHGMIVDGLVINAAALVNGGSIDWVPMAELPERVTYYHVETENHDVILANGAPAETFIDYAGRQAFDNYGEYVELYGAERIIPEMDRPRISAQRLVPQAIKARLGIVEPEMDWDARLTA